VLYTHGYIPAAAPVGIASVEALGEHLAELRAFLLAYGFAVAYSSYSENGFNVKEGAIATNQLRELFAAKVRPPGSTFLIAQSLGALDAMALVERDPDSYSGVLSVAGVLAGSQAAIDYYGHVRVLFDLFYPGVLPGSLLELPNDIDLFNDIIVPAATAMALHPEGAFAISQLDQAPVPFRDGTELDRRGTRRPRDRAGRSARSNPWPLVLRKRQDRVHVRDAAAGGGRLHQRIGAALLARARRGRLPRPLLRNHRASSRAGDHASHAVGSDRSVVP
jgi:hypothetical protein